MASVESKLRDLLELAQVVLDDLPVGLLVLSAHGKPLWFNREAEVVCAVWNRTPLRKDALPLKRADFIVPAVLWQECQALLAADDPNGAVPEPRILDEADSGLHAVIRLQRRPGRTGPPACFLQLDYRRPRGDRDRPISSVVRPSRIRSATSRSRKVRRDSRLSAPGEIGRSRSPRGRR